MRVINFGKKLSMRRLLIIFVATLLVTFIPGAAIATASDVTIYPLICSDNTHIYLEYGINTVTLTNPNGCDLTSGFSLVDGTYDSTWTYSKTISGTTTSGPYPNSGGVGFNTGALGSADSFSLTQTSGGLDSVRFVNGFWDFNIHFNRQFGTLNPDPVGIGQEVTVTGSNLSSVTSMFFSDGIKYFSFVTGNRTSSQLTFTVPSTYVDFMGQTITVTPGTYTLGDTTKTLTIISAPPATTAPDAPTIGTATALSPTSASISFTAPASNGGATIETYTATSTPGSFTGQLLQAGSGSITVTGLTSSTAYTFTVTASNSAGTSSASSASTSITIPASDEELAEQAAQATAARDAAARAASAAAAVRREAEKKSARSEILDKFRSSEKATIETFNQAEIAGITKENIEAASAEILALPDKSRSDITQVLEIARKYEVVGKIASEQVSTVYSSELIEVGLISAESKHKATLTAALRKLPAPLRSSYAQIEVALNAHMETIQARKDRLAAVIARNAARNAA